MNIVTTDQTTSEPLFLGRPLVFWIGIGIAAFILLAVIIWHLTTAPIRVTYHFADQAREGKVSLQVLTAQGETQPVTEFLGLIFVPRSAASIIAQTDNSQTITALNSPPLLTVASYNLELQPQRQLTKIASDGKGCNMTNQFGTFSYNCTDPTDMVKIVHPDDGNWRSSKVLSSGIDNNTFTRARYLEGFLTIQYPVPQAASGTPARLEYAVPGAQPQYVSLPASFVSDKNDRLTVITDAATAADTAFVLANVTKGTFLYAPSFTKVGEAKGFSRSASTNTKFNNSACSLNKTQLACFYGRSSAGGDDIENEDQVAYDNYYKQHPYPQLEVINPASPTERQTYELKDIQGADFAFLTAAKNVYLRQNDLLFRVTLDDKRASTQLVTRADSMVVRGGSVFYTTEDNRVMEYIDTEQTAYLRFKSDKLNGFSLTTSGDSVLLNSFLAVDITNQYSNISQIFQIDSQPLDKNAKRKEDILPYVGDNLGIYFMDYDASSILVSMRPSYITDGSGARTLDTAGINQRAERVRKQLESDGLLSGLKLIIK